MDFKSAYEQLNQAQRRAVDQYEGPMLIIAGPGTGKTQLLSTRVANILKQTDTLPQNILCLTFTENGANNMRERLTQQIGQDAYRVQINTYHAFGSEIIGRYPEYFSDFYLQNPVDDLGRFETITTIIDELPFNSPLKHTQYYPGDLLSTISDIKQSALSAQDLKNIASDNQHYYDAINKIVLDVFSDFKSMPRKLDLAVSYFTRLRTEVSKLPTTKYQQPFASLQQLLIDSLNQAILDTAELKTKPLTAWKNTWLEKNSDNKFILCGRRTSDTLRALASVSDEYNSSLRAQNLYDYDDMILQAIQLLKTNDDLRFSLQEKYLYILLDEFQDTNKAQAELIYLLSDNPVNEGRPNIMAVGDDDQAIFEFQGANISNMLNFANRFDNTTIVNLTENFRSHQDILHVAQNIAEQIESRLSDNFPEITKTLTSSSKNLPKDSEISRRDFSSPPAQYSWITARIKELIDDGVSPKEIAVLSPRHMSLESLVMFLNNAGIPVHYEKRENILDSTVIQQLISMAKLLLALDQQDELTANALWPEILSYDFMNIPTLTIWQMAWQVSDSRGKISWSQLLVKDPLLKPTALFMKTLSELVQMETLETILDYLIGSCSLAINDPEITTYTSPLKAYYLSVDSRASHGAGKIYEMLSNLTVLRSRLRSHQASSDRTLKISDFISFIDLHNQSGTMLLNTSPYSQSKDSVQLMTVFKAKGLEFEHVFIIDAKDDTWGESSRGNSSKISLPVNLQPIQHKRTSADEKLRILFVAITRAKFGLHITNTLNSYSGKPTKRLSYLDEQEQSDGHFKSLVLPESKQSIAFDDHNSPSLETLELSWRTRHIEASAQQLDLKDLLSERLEKYKLSPTHLNSFLDVEYSGPETFFINTILRFPQAPSDATSFGNAIHTTLEWLQNEINQSSEPNIDNTIKYYQTVLASQHLSTSVFVELLSKGELSLRAYLGNRSSIFQPGFKPEVNFSYENILYKNVRLNGKIDKLIVDKSNKTLEIIDYKTGKPHSKWDATSKLHGYKLQLYFYRLLLENSTEFKDYQVIDERLEFIEPDQDGKIHTLSLKFDEKEYERIKKLTVVVWQHIMELDFPDTKELPTSLTGIKKFENTLLSD